MTCSPDRSAVVFCCDCKGLPIAAFAAAKIAQLSPDRRFDILIGGPEAMVLPDWLSALGVSSFEVAFGDGADDVRAAGAGHLPDAAYLRLWVPGMLRGRYSRILYLDYDIFPRGGDLNRLLSADMSGAPLAAVRDLKQWRDPTKPVFELEANVLGGLPYFNSGVLLIDVDRWCALEVTERCAETARQKPIMYTHDQGLLNLTLRGAWAELSPVWNWHMTRQHHLLFGILGVNLLHFAGMQKPWSPGPAQLKHDANVVLAYQAFLNDHFPEAAVRIEPRSFAQSALLELPETAYEYLLIRRFLRRFQSDYQLLAPRSVLDPSKASQRAGY